MLQFTPSVQVPRKFGMNLVNIEMVIFDARGFGFGTEVSRIISIQRHCKGRLEQMDLPWAPAYAGGARKDLESVPLVDLSAQLWARKRGTHSYTVDRTEISGVKSQELSLKSISAVRSDGENPPYPWKNIGRSQGSLLQRSTDGAGTAILLVNTTAGTKGVHVESVRGIVKMPLEQIEPLPEFLKSRMQTDCIWGIGKLEEELIILLDIDRYVLELPF